ncbi:MAG: corrinoid ABC transporter substrate-binding protein [Methanosaeta sp. PtaU1.Bin060]|nr:MAG: corrinoid ABC transporter substrate-binding protein [Methanosaeta sp. PtaU1.Bin060]
MKRMILAALCISLFSMSGGAMDYALGIFGNANMDDTIDEKDVEYVEGVIKGAKVATNLSDANYDGKIDDDDIAQIEQIISGEEKELTLIDSADRIVTVNLPIKTVVVMDQAPAMALVALGQEDKVIGVGSWITSRQMLFPKLSQLPSAGSSESGADWEKVLELKPDVFIHNTVRCTGQCEENLGHAGITVLRFNFYEHPYDIIQSWQKFGYLFDEKNKGKEFIDWYLGYLDTITKRVEGLSEEDKPLVYYEFGDYRAFVEQGRAVRGYMPAMAGGINIAAGDLSTNSSVTDVDPEWVITKNPDYIFKNLFTTAGSGYEVDDPSEMKALRDSMIGRPELAGVDAVKNKRVYVLSGCIACAPQFVVGVAYMAKVLHPDLFQDLDPDAMHQEFLTRFMKLDYDVNEHGTFIYPPIECGDDLLGIPDRYKGELL